MGTNLNSKSDLERKAELRSRGVEFGRSILNGIKLRKLTKTQVCEKLGLTYNGLSLKLKGERPFTAAEVECLADWWGLPVDDVIGRDHKRHESTDSDD